jgi:hypothetical protein
MTDEAGPKIGDKRSGSALAQHPLVSSVRPDPSRPPQSVISLTGLPGDSAKAGYQRLYLTATLDYHAEFLANDIVYSSELPIEKSPFAGHTAMLICIRREAIVDYTWTRSLQPVDEFDLDVRLQPLSDAAVLAPRSGFTSCDGCSLGLSCAHCPSRGHCTR